jgi:hypothetical protein
MMLNTESENPDVPVVSMIADVNCIYKIVVVPAAKHILVFEVT